MKTLFKYLKKYLKSILIIVILLVIQANCDLSLPTYTSDIINVGIAQGGIDSSIPKVIRRSTMKTLLEFVTKDEKAEILASFSFINNHYDRYVEKYPVLATETIYLLNGEYSKNLEELLLKPILIVSMLNSSEENTMFTSPITLEEYLALTDVEQEVILQEITNKIDSIPTSFGESAAVAFVRAEYEAIGMDTGKIQTDYIIKTGIKMLVLALVSMIATILVGLVGAKMAASLAKSLRSGVFNKVLTFSNTEMKKFGVASLITRSTNDVTQVQMMIVMIVRTVIYAPIIGFGALFKVLNSDVSMAWIIGLAIIAIFSIIITLFIFVLPKFTILQKLVDKLNLVAREILTGILPIRAFSNEKHEELRFDDANKQLKKVSLFVNRMMSTMMPLMTLIMNAVSVLIVWYGAKEIGSGALTLGNMMAFIQYATQIIMSFLMISMVSIMIPRAIVSLKRIDEVILQKVSIENPDNPKTFSNKEKGIVEFKKVSFRYPDANYDVISDINFKALPGTTTAFIGSTGSGKSTLINLIPRLFDVTTGEILIDGVNIKDVTLSDLRERIAYIPQKGILFSGTIEENIKYSNLNLETHEMIRAARIAQADEFIESNKEKYASLLAQGGSNVSGGQKQRLSIARAIAKDAYIYIFDDSFSALDFKTDSKLRSAIKKEMKNKTILIVAQRVSTIMNASQIVVLDEGSIVGIGTHEELLEKCKIYQEIAKSQLGEEALRNGKKTSSEIKEKTTSEKTSKTTKSKAKQKSKSKTSKKA